MVSAAQDTDDVRVPVDDDTVQTPSGDAAATRDRRQFLGEILVARRLLTQEKLDNALLKQRVSGKRLGALLVDLGMIDERDLAEALGEHFGVATIDLRREAPETDAVERLPEGAARSLLALPLRLAEGILVVAVADPSDQLMSELSALTRLDVELVVAATTDIRRAIDQSYRALAAVDRHVDAFEAANTDRRAQQSAASVAVDENAPVVQVVNLVLAQALRDRASDVHIEPMDALVRVRYRIDGVLHDVLSLPAEMGAAVISRLKVLAGMNIVERRKAQDGQVAMDVEGRAIDLRVASTGTVAGEKLVLRVLDKSRPQFRLSELGMPPDTYRIFGELVRSPYGMVICAGPTGSGKTTSLYATLSELNAPERNIMTIEDPVEYVFPSINQIQINAAAGVTFATGLRSILRQDPDVILVGEIRDEETARIAIQSALTGHLVLSTLHATDATSALLRFLDMGIEPFVVSSAVTGVISQRLIRRICDQCRVQYRPTTDELDFYVDAGGTRKVTRNSRFWRGEGCTFCSNTGFQDRVGVYELLRMTPEMKQLVAQRPTHQDVRDLAAEQGTRTLREEAVRLVGDGVTTVAEVVRGIHIL